MTQETTESEIKSVTHVPAQCREGGSFLSTELSGLKECPIEDPDTSSRELADFENTDDLMLALALEVNCALRFSPAIGSE